MKMRNLTQSTEMKKTLLNAVESGDFESVRSYFESSKEKKNLNDPDGVQLRPEDLLHAAVLEKNTEIVKFLVNFGADVSLVNNEGLTALQCALNWDYPNYNCSIIKILVSAGADVNTTSQVSRDKTVLHAAAEASDVELVKLLIDRKADVKAKSYYLHWTALHWAARGVKSEDPSIFKYLLRANADVNAKSYKREETPLHILFKFKPTIQFNLCKILEVFKEYGADFEAAAKTYYRLPWLLANLNGYSEAIKALVLVGGVDVNIEFGIYSRRTFLLNACDGINLPMVKFLIKNGANFDALDEDCFIQRIIGTIHFDDRETELFWKKMELILYLLKRNININVVTSTGENVLTPVYYQPIYLRERLLEHIAKLKAAGKPVNSIILETIYSNFEYREYFEKCTRELETAKDTRIHPDNWVTVYNILMDDKKNLVRYAGSQVFVNSFTKIKWTKKFSVYGSLAKQRFSKAMENRKIWDRAAVALSDLLPKKVEPSHIVIISILNFCSIKDLRKLSQ